MARRTISSSHLSLRTPDLPEVPTYLLKPGQPTPGSLSLLRHPIATNAGAGILTSFPSTTLFSLALGADSPCADERCAGTLSLSARRIFTSYIVTYVSILTSDTSTIPHSIASSLQNAPLPFVMNSLRTRSFGT